MRVESVLVAASWLIVGSLAAAGSVDAKPVLHFSSRERSACSGDAIRYCASTFPSKRALVSCLQSHRSSLGRSCRRALYRGVSERPSLSH